ncbi:hypothetical protein BSL78_10303 [Apostichopus japonicus]|uniref:Uncharacterized protein n=1 Tax=Stichopus japonicus TaxID=307972 RepID=A0A2G8KXU6_STIJA|nr:hypothetical protein BSL78_10303 [Apostichopus japonicus]
MGKKKSKKSDKKADQGADGSSKKEPQMTIREAILAYQISIKENQLGELMFEKMAWKRKTREIKRGGIDSRRSSCITSRHY